MGRHSERDEKQTGKAPAVKQPPAPPSPDLAITVLCPYCKSALRGERIVRCSECGTAHHALCWKEHGHCSLLNCSGHAEISIRKGQLISAGMAVAIVAVAAAWLLIYQKPAVHLSAPVSIVKSSKSSEASFLPCADNPKTQELMEAARYNQTERIQKLIQLGGDLNAPAHVSIFVKNDHCWTPLLTASYFGSADTARLLLQAGANVESTDEYQRTPLLAAVLGNHSETVHLLLSAGADVHASDHSGDTCLTLVVMRGNLDILRALIKADADVNSPNGLGYTPLIQALRAKQWDAAKVLIDSNADPNLTDRNGRSALSWACESADLQMLRAILHAGASVNDADANRTTPLMWATRANRPDAVKLLIASGADIEAVDAQKNTALAYAQKAYEKEIVEILSNDKVHH